MYRAIVASLGIALLASPVLADDRSPNGEERAALENVLRAKGYVSWEDIEYDDDSSRRSPVWDVENARDAKGRIYDLKIRPGTYKILSRVRDLD